MVGQDRSGAALLPEPPRPGRRARVSALAFVTGCAALFGLIAEDVVDGGRLVSRDQALLGWFVEHRSPWMVHAARVVSTVGSFVPLVLLCALVALWLWLWRRGVRVWVAVSPVAALALAGGASTVAKSLLGRPRPPVQVRDAAVSLASFPSGHATDAAAFVVAMTVVLAITVAPQRWQRLWLLAAVVVVAGVVGVSRLVLGVHWLSDVVAGWALGAGVAVATVVAVWDLTGRPTR